MMQKKKTKKKQNLSVRLQYTLKIQRWQDEIHALYALSFFHHAVTSEASEYELDGLNDKP